MKDYFLEGTLYPSSNHNLTSGSTNFLYIQVCIQNHIQRNYHKWDQLEITFHKVCIQMSSGAIIGIILGKYLLFYSFYSLKGFWNFLNNIYTTDILLCARCSARCWIQDIHHERQLFDLKEIRDSLVEGRRYLINYNKVDEYFDFRRTGDPTLNVLKAYSFKHPQCSLCF